MSAKYLYDLAIFASNDIVKDFKSGFVQRFHRQACCISERFLKYLSEHKVRTDGVAKVQIVMVDHRDHTQTIPVPDPLEDVICCEWPYHFHDYLKADEYGKKQQIASTARDCLVAVAETWHWDAEPFIQMYEVTQSEQFVFTGVSKISWVDPTSRFRVKIDFDWRLEEIELSAVLFKNRSSHELARKYLGTMIPGMWQLTNVFARPNGQWVSSVEFELHTSDFTQRRWKVSFADVMSHYGIR